MVLNTASPNAAFATTAIGNNRQSTSNSGNDIATSDKESSHSFSDIDEVVEEDLDNPSITIDERVRNSATDSDENANQQKVSFTEQAKNEPYKPSANDMGGTGVSAEPIIEKRSSYDEYIDHDLRTREGPT